MRTRWGAARRATRARVHVVQSYAHTRASDASALLYTYEYEYSVRDSRSLAGSRRPEHSWRLRTVRGIGISISALGRATCFQSRRTCLSSPLALPLLQRSRPSGASLSVSVSFGSLGGSARYACACACACRSFDSINNWLRNIEEVRAHWLLVARFYSCRLRVCDTVQHANTDVEVLLVGNKTDMADKRAVSNALAQQARYFFFFFFSSSSSFPLPSRPRLLPGPAPARPRPGPPSGPLSAASVQSAFECAPRRSVAASTSTSTPTRAFS